MIFSYLIINEKKKRSNIIKISKKKLYIFKLFNFYIKKLK